ncbi:YTH domain-containing family protein isoform X2 [Episyrphus balteatus]|uniref:YTH domain-containing family protein isoform X2 n=1 Tax=Episyrphus balteatus TaxID=286459 RepID=UPI002485BDAD|nr:YTH domain-containing family protein isoform X2 [Episyrphus balteatus]
MSGVSDPLKRQPAVKRMDENDTIPWSQQVDEDICEGSSYTTENRPETKNEHRQPKDYMRSNDNYSAEKLNPLNVLYNSKKDNISRMSSEETQKAYFDDSCGRGHEAHKKGDDLNQNKKKITWASIASQPAKPNKRNNIALKKKGPGMPPPPMIPGKHALNVNPWDLAVNSFSTETSGNIPNFIPTNETISEDDLSTKWKIQNSEQPQQQQQHHQQQQQHQHQQHQPQQQQHQPQQQQQHQHQQHQPQHQQQHSDFSRKKPNNYYNKPVKNAKSYSSSVEIVLDRSIVPKQHEEKIQNIRQINVSNNYNSQESYLNESCGKSSGANSSMYSKSSECSQPNTTDCSEIVLKQLKDRNNYNPMEMDMQNANLSRYFVIKSYSEDDIHRSIKYEIWCSTDHGNKKLDDAFKERMKEGGHVMLFFSVNGSGHFCGMAQMMTPVDYESTASVWSQDKWKGKFKVKWIYVKDVPNSQLRHIRLENNENKSVTNSRDTQEIPLSQGLQMLKILHLYKHLTSIFDDFYHYEKKQEESVSKKPTHFDNHVHSLSSANMCHGDNNKELNNEWLPPGNMKERAIFHRGEHSNAMRNRRNGGKPMMEHKRNIDAQDKPTVYINHDKPDNEDHKQHALDKHSNPSIENSGSKFNYKEIVLHVNSFNCNDNSTVRENIHTK